MASHETESNGARTRVHRRLSRPPASTGNAAAYLDHRTKQHAILQNLFRKYLEMQSGRVLGDNGVADDAA